ncbi:hypothetical protein BRADI_2g62097v3, partial [Brachypodium distachyon]
MDDRTRWADLPPDLVRVISGHVRDAADLVRFHAVCKPWRDSRRCHPLSSPGTSTAKAQLLLPWLLAPPPPADSKDPMIRFRTLATSVWHTEFCFCAAYHRGKILFTVDARQWRVVVFSGDEDEDVLVPSPWMLYERRHYPRQYSYALESRGELLWAAVQTVHALSESESEESPATENKKKKKKKKKQLRWVRRDGQSLTDRALFLGHPSSFAMDASRLGIGIGGWAYLVHHDGNKASPREQAGVLKHNLVSGSGEAEFLERLPQGWAGGGDGRHFAWLDHPWLETWRGIITGHVSGWRCMRGLPLTVRSSQLRRFLGEHGSVSEAEVVRYKKTKASQGIGFVTIATRHSNQEDAVDALDGLLLDGIRLQ